MTKVFSDSLEYDNTFSSFNNIRLPFLVVEQQTKYLKPHQYMLPLFSYLCSFYMIVFYQSQFAVKQNNKMAEKLPCLQDTN